MALCGHPEGRDGRMGGRSKAGRHVRLIPVAVWHKPTQRCKAIILKLKKIDFSNCLVIKNLPANAGDTSLIPDPQRSHMPRDS